MKKISVPAGYSAVCAMEILNSIGVKSGAYIPNPVEEDRFSIMIKGRPMPQKDLEDMGLFDIEEAKTYLESKGCEVFIEAVNEEVACDNPMVSKLKSLKKGQKFDLGDYKDLEITSMGLHEAYYINEAINALKDSDISENKLKKALLKMVNPYGIRVIGKKPETLAAHVINKEQAAGLVETLDKFYEGRPRVLAVGFDSDINYMDFSEELFADAFQIMTCKLKNHVKALAAHDIAADLRDINPNITETDSPSEARELAGLLAGDKGIVVLINQ